MASFTLHIQYVDRPPETRTFADRDRITIGRDIGDIALRDSQVSGRHGEITFMGGVLRFNDTGSTNGTFLLDGRKISTIDLTPGMAIRVGNSLITVHMIDSPLAGKGRTMIAGAGVAPFAPTPPTRPPMGPVGAPMSQPPIGAQGPRTQIPNTGADELAYAPTSAMPAAMPPGFPQPPAQPPAQPPGFPPPPTAPPVMAIPEPVAVAEGDGSPTAPAVPPVGAPISATPPSLSGDEFKSLFEQAWKFYQPHLLPAGLIIGGLTVPVAVASWILAFIPVVGWLLALILSLGQAILMILGFAALSRYILGAFVGQPIGWVDAWKQQIANAKEVWPNFFVAGLIAGVGMFFLIIPGILLGAFIGPIYFCEGRRMFDINLRNLDLAKREPVMLIVAIIIVAIATAIAVIVPMLILGFIPILGTLLAAVLSAAVGAIVGPYIMTLTTILYFRTRRRYEGGDPEAQAAAALAAGGAPAMPPGTGAG
ncbi:MAG: FHA domain-containing protein [Nannocystaceae bacterium]